MRRIFSKRAARPTNEPRTHPTPAEQRRRQRRQIVLATLLLALMLWATMAISPPSIPGLRPGLPSPVSIQANQSISFKSTLRTEQARLNAENDPRNIVYRNDPATLIDQRAQLAGLLRAISAIRDNERLSANERLVQLSKLPNSSLVISETLATRIDGLAPEPWASVAQASLDLYDRAVRENRYVLSPAALDELRSNTLPYWAALAADEHDDLVLLFTTAFLKSNQVIDEAQTAQRKQAAANAVQPVMISIQQGESIVRPGDVVTPEIQEKLEALGTLRLATNWLRLGGQGLLAGLIALAFGMYLALTQRGARLAGRQLLVIYGGFAITVLLARLLLPVAGEWPYAFPLATTIILLATLFNGSLALIAASLLSLLIAFLAEGNYALAVTLLLGSLAGMFAVGRPSRSLTFLLAGLAVAAITLVCQLAFSLLAFGGPTVEQIVLSLSISGLNGALSAILALGLYNFTGHLAGVITPFQLMELAHPSQPLLRKLMREAPGTYYHSVAVGNLAESAAEAVGADALLLRVAAYYHDIGKTIRPYFFTDNQSDRDNVHDDLDPHTSAQIIADHVREGLRMARAAGVPPQVLMFIPTHHGTTIIKHFYQLAMQQQDSVNIEDFRYPGPKPQTREQAILMLADSVEATVRSKAQHGQIISAREVQGLSNGRGGKQTLEELVNSIIDERVRSGQLDESALTLHDLAGIRQAFVSTLAGIYHPRVDYAPQVVKTP